MSRMTRSFLPVGQGAFYCERWPEVKGAPAMTVVYDCGALNAKKGAQIALQREIKELNPPGATIDAVFLSHLDDDHVNGLPALLEYYQVKHIFFPLLTQEASGYTAFYNRLQAGEGSFSETFVRAPQQAVKQAMRSESLRECAERPLPILCAVSPEEREVQTEQTLNLQHVKVIQGGDVTQHLVGSGWRPWCYKVYNFEQPNRLTRLKKELRAKFDEAKLPGQEITPDALEDIWRRNDQKAMAAVKKAYQAVPGTLNCNSMCLYSGPQSGVWYQQGWLEQSASSPGRQALSSGIAGAEPHPAGALYLGDYEANGERKYQRLKECFAEEEKQIGCIQLPHHGSCHNFNKELLKQSPCYFAVSTGVGNRYHHPHKAVLRACAERHILLYIVSEQESTRLDLEIQGTP